MTFVSYAQNFEDVILHRVLSRVAQGFYVDVGAQHPIDDSVTKAFSIAGWRGINIEPVKQWFDMLVADRPHDINLNVAVGDTGDLRLFEVEGTGLSTTDADLARRYGEQGYALLEYIVPAVSLDRIFEDVGVSDVHFLKVDCEGAERTALASCAFDSVRPWIVVVEATEPNSQVGNQHKWEDILLSRDYLSAYYDGLNRYYVAREHSDLLESFSAPPNVFDDFIRARDKRAHDDLHDLHFRARDIAEELTNLRPTVANLAASLEAAHRQYDERLAAAASLEAALRAEMGALQDEVTKLRADIAARRADVAAVRNELLGRLRAAEEIEVHATQTQHLVNELRASNSLLQSEIARRDAHIQALVTSTSWRVTMPIRWGKVFMYQGARATWRVSRPTVAKAAKMARPAIHAILAFPGVKPAARRLLPVDSRLGRRIRQFVVARPSPELTPANAVTSPEALTEQAQAMEALLKDVIRQRSQ